jgi:hypothetical protein
VKNNVCRFIQPDGLREIHVNGRLAVFQRHLTGTSRRHCDAELGKPRAQEWEEMTPDQAGTAGHERSSIACFQGGVEDPVNAALRVWLTTLSRAVTRADRRGVIVGNVLAIPTQTTVAIQRCASGGEALVVAAEPVATAPLPKSHEYLAIGFGP